ncbi:MAG TPA: ABC transporter permease [Dehalococcoidales bacterium]
MRNITTIAVKEFKSYLASPMAYIVTSVFLLGTGLFFVNFGSFEMSVASVETSIRGILGDTIYIVLVLLLMAILAMRLLAEERKLGTIELLMTAPVRDSEVIIGKFLGSVGVWLVMLVFTIYYPIMLIIFGDPDIGPIGTGYLGLFLLGCASLAVGIFTSSLTSNQIVSAVVSGGILLALWFLGAAATSLPQTVGNVIGYFTPATYFSDFVRGIIDTRGIIYYLSIIALFLFLAIRSLENSRWS